MKAFLLAAGVGSRLQPLTDSIPKCLLPIAGTPLIDIWLEAFERAGVDEVLVNLHHLPELVGDHLASRCDGPAILTRLEPRLLGSAGTLAANREWIEDEDLFLACNADNLTDFDLRELVSFHRSHGAPATLSVFHAADPTACGIVDLDPSGRVVGFVEKPSEPASDLANAGMYAFEPSVLDLVSGSLPLDIGFDLLPNLVGRSFGVAVPGYFRDIGTVEAYETAQRDWTGR